MNVHAFALNAFAKAAGGGNPAGVVLDADWLTEAGMQKAAAALGFSETAFVRQSDRADFALRFFTPAEEVDLCGHATIGTFCAMASQQVIPPGDYTQETRAGILGVRVHADGSVLMEQTAPSFHGSLPPAAIAASLGLTPADLTPGLPVEIVSTGLKDILVPVRDLCTLRSLTPDFAMIEAISRQYDVTGYHVFTAETLYGGTAHCRNFAPLYAIPEESATGTSSGALAAYLFRHGQIAEASAGRLVMEQGYVMNRPSEILVSLTIAGTDITAVQVGGSALDLRPLTVQI